MAFRVGLLFHSSPGRPLQTSPVASLLQEIAERTKPVRSGESLTLVPFVRTNEEVAFSLDVAGSAYPTEAATWGEGGVVFRPLQALANFQHLAREPRLDFDRGMEAILSLSHVVVVLCASAASAEEFDEVASRAASFQGTGALMALVSLENTWRFLDMDRKEPRVERADWLVDRVMPRWEAAKPSLHSVPSANPPILGLLFPWLIAAIIRRRFENVKRRPRAEAERCREGMGISDLALKKLHLDDQRLLNANLKRLCPFFARHDELGRYYSNVFRTTCLLVPLLIAASTVLAVAGVIDSKRRDLWHIVEGVLLVIAAWLVIRSKLAGQHAKWVEHRLATELMRFSVVCNLLYTIPRLTSPHEEPKRWEEQTRVFWTYFRSLPPISFCTPSADLLSARRSAVADYATNQEQFHTDFAEQHYRAQKWLVKISGRAFFAALCLAVAQLTIAHLAEPREGLAVKLMMATLIFAGGAFVVSLLAHQLGFEAIAERSRNAAEHFRLLRAAIDQGAHSADARQVYAWAHECAQFILAEQHS